MMRLIIVIILLLTCGTVVAQPDEGTVQTDSFADAVDLSPLDKTAVHVQGRLKSFESFARSYMQGISGPRLIDDRAPGYTFFDMMLRPAGYTDADVIFVRKKPMRGQFIAALRNSPNKASIPDFDARMERFLDTGLISERLLRDEHVAGLIDRLGRDLIRTAKFVEQLEWAVELKRPFRMRASFRVVPPAGGGFQDQWFTPDEIARTVHAGGAPDASMETEHALVAQWNAMTQAWTVGDAAGVNAAVAELANLLPTVNPDLYPDESRLGWESWYFRAGNMTWVWLLYLLSIVPLLLFVAFRWPAARWVGLALFVIAFGFHTFAIGLRWYVSARWPNSNMFEAVTTAAWFGGCFAIALEMLLGRTAMRGLFAVTSAAGSMVALMAAHFLPLQLNPAIGNMMPVLHDVWLYIHTNVIIFSYCLIFMAAVSAVLYLIYRLAGGARDYARVGGAGSLIMTTPDGGSYLARERTSAGQVLDGVTMVLMELAFVLLWAGLVMGAIWADHSWGRPWGWDAKEVFALNTFLVFAILVHVRLKVRDKGLWTAILAVIGCGVMLFNWIVINFFIVGLHSYA